MKNRHQLGGVAAFTGPGATVHLDPGIYIDRLGHGVRRARLILELALDIGAIGDGHYATYLSKLDEFGDHDGTIGNELIDRLNRAALSGVWFVDGSDLHFGEPDRTGWIAHPDKPWVIYSPDAYLLHLYLANKNTLKGTP